MIPAGYTRNVISGTAPGGEIWQFGFWQQGTDDNQADANAGADTLWSDLSLGSFGTALRAMIDASSAITAAKRYCYPNGGPNAQFIGEHDGSLAGTGTGQLPLQTALVCTLLTGAAGRQNRGRMYLPAFAMVGSAHQAVNATVDNLAAAIAGFFTQVGGDGADPVVVLSQVAGAARPVTSVRVDSRFDIQRRRANREAAAHTASEAVPVV